MEGREFFPVWPLKNRSWRIDLHFAAHSGWFFTEPVNASQIRGTLSVVATRLTAAIFGFGLFLFHHRSLDFRGLLLSGTRRLDFLMTSEQPCDHDENEFKVS
jgi:hypothetical protein